MLDAEPQRACNLLGCDAVRHHGRETAVRLTVGIEGPELDEPVERITPAACYVDPVRHSPA